MVTRIKDRYNLILSFILYVSLVTQVYFIVSVKLFPIMLDRNYIQSRMDWVPFSMLPKFGWHTIGYYADGLSLFIPFGFIVYLILHKYRFKYTLSLCISFIFAVSITIGQYMERFWQLTYRLPNVTDVILGTLGGVLGILLAIVTLQLLAILNKIKPKRLSITNKRQTIKT